MRTVTAARGELGGAERLVSDFSVGRVRVAVPAAARVMFWPVATTLVLVVIAAENGGYYPTTWNWAALVIAWAAARTLSVREAVTLSRLELVTIGALIALSGWVALSGIWSDSLCSSTKLSRSRETPAGRPSRA